MVCVSVRLNAVRAVSASDHVREKQALASVGGMAIPAMRSGEAKMSDVKVMVSGTDGGQDALMRSRHDHGLLVMASVVCVPVQGIESCQGAIR